MKRISLAVLVAFILQVFTGCAGVGISAATDPGVKLNMALDLIDRQNRPIPAERLIREAIDQYQASRDELEIANAYRIYGIFYKSPAVSQWRQHYEKVGFPDSTVKFETRYQKALEYFEKSRAILEAHQDKDLMANIYMQTGLTYQLMGKSVEACNAFDASLKAYKTIMAQDPSAKVVLTKEHSSFEQGILKFKKQAGCNV